MPPEREQFENGGCQLESKNQYMTSNTSCHARACLLMIIPDRIRASTAALTAASLRCDDVAEPGGRGDQTRTRACTIASMRIVLSALRLRDHLTHVLIAVYDGG
jgi:hypothetical protein